ncbi:MAG: hypothetical protein IJQ53_02155 [Clostridia bacterium]|nr:hypothetical protein [Clostridia bacterium]
MNQNPQYQQPQQPQQPQQQQYQQNPQYQQYQQPVYYQRPPMEKSKVFGILVAAIFGLVAVFALVAMIGFCVKLQAHAGLIISYILVIFAAAGIATAPFVKKYTKFFIMISGLLLAFGYYGISMIMIAQSFGCFVVILGVLAFAFMCWLAHTNNNLLKMFWFVPPALIFIGALINWIVMKYFSVGMKFALAFYLFDFLCTIFLIGGSVVLGLYLVLKHGEKSVSFKIPNPAPRAPQQPQQPYQGQ